jgi:hypothetical protein
LTAANQQELWRSRALSLMRMALALLERAEETSVTIARLQHAIDTAAAEWPVTSTLE